MSRTSAHLTVEEKVKKEGKRELYIGASGGGESERRRTATRQLSTSPRRKMRKIGKRSFKDGLAGMEL